MSGIVRNARRQPPGEGVEGETGTGYEEEVCPDNGRNICSGGAVVGVVHKVDKQKQMGLEHGQTRAGSAGTRSGRRD